MWSRPLKGHHDRGMATNLHTQNTTPICAVKDLRQIHGELHCEYVWVKNHRALKRVCN
jgi:hypothetical protein